MNLIKLARANRRSFFLLLWMATVPIIISGLITYFALDYESIIRAFDWKEWSLFFIASILSMAFALTPTTFMALLSGFFLGMEAIFAMAPCYLLASLIGYQLAHRIDKGIFLNTLNDIPKAKEFIKLLKGKQTGIIILSRISPVLPFAVMNVVLSVIKVRILPFLFAGFVGMLPRTLLFIWIGSQANELKTLLMEGGESHWDKVSFILLLLISLLGFYWYLKGMVNKILNKDQKKK
jgi:uncharacterized membrane protein YdjX (TVP38/TMEM64 family)